MKLYVDDTLMTSNDLEMIVTTKGWLTSNFRLKDMGDASYVLGAKIHKNGPKRVLGLSQKKYLMNILERFKMHNSKFISTLVEKNHHLSLQDSPKTLEERQYMACIPYSNTVECLMYAMFYTRLDISFTVGLLNHFHSNIGLSHWNVIKRALRCLRGSIDYVLCYGGSGLWFNRYTYVDDAGDLNERKLTFATLYFLEEVLSLGVARNNQ